VNRRTAAVDLAAAMLGIVAAWGLTRLLLYPALGIADNVPAILRPITGFFVAWWMLHHRGTGWHSLGLVTPPSWWRALATATALYLATYAVSNWLVAPLAQLFQPVAQPSFFAALRGNLPATLLWVGIGCVVGGFMEECLFRGFLLNRVAAMLGGGRAALAIGVVAQALLFGALHLYGGTFAFVFAACAALVSGTFYLVAGRNLWPLIAAHATWNTVSIWGVYQS
jgi:membrane protease YdiL (CAAX protease family)